MTPPAAAAAVASISLPGDVHVSSADSDARAHIALLPSRCNRILGHPLMRHLRALSSLTGVMMIWEAIWDAAFTAQVERAGWPRMLVYAFVGLLGLMLTDSLFANSGVVPPFALAKRQMAVQQRLGFRLQEQQSMRHLHVHVDADPDADADTDTNGNAPVTMPQCCSTGATVRQPELPKGVQPAAQSQRQRLHDGPCDRDGASDRTVHPPVCTPDSSAAITRTLPPHYDSTITDAQPNTQQRANQQQHRAHAPSPVPTPPADVLQALGNSKIPFTMMQG